MEDELGNKIVCFYCKEYSKIYADYPLNSGTKNKFNDLTPRCELHFQYQCDNCKASIHFNGISFCVDCNLFTCLGCSNIELQFEDFFYYDCYYKLNCYKCKKDNPCLDYAEYALTHPYQMGTLKPKTPLALWVPSSEPDSSKVGSKFGWGSNRILDLVTENNFQPVEGASSEDSKEVWNHNAEQWKEIYGEDGDYHHKNLIIPNMLDMINIESFETHSTKILDIGSGFGKLCRIFAKKGFTITGLDFSERMIKISENYEKKDTLGIKYVHGDALKLDDLFENNSHNLIISNMAIMDIPDTQKMFRLIFQVLKSKGTFVFSVSHPVFSWPVTYSIKLPRDTQKNEDKIWVINDYFDTKPKTREQVVGSFRFLTFRLTFSDYINSLVNTGFLIKEVRELQASEELAKKLPRESFRDDTRVPVTMIFKVTKPLKRIIS